MEIYKERNFSEVFADSFGFIRKNFKSIISSFFIIAGPIVFIRALAAANIISDTFSSSISGFTFVSIISLIAGVLAYIVILGIVAEYYFLTAEHPDKPITYQDIFQALKKDFGNIFSTFLSMMLLSIIAGLALAVLFFIFSFILGGVPVVGAILMFLLFIGLLLIFPNLSFMFIAVYIIRLREKCSFSQALSTAYSLTMENYWQTWVVVFVTFILVFVIVGIQSFILGILIAVQSFNSTSDIYATPDAFSWISVVSFFMEFIFMFVQMFVYFITMLWAFSLYEKKFAVGMQQKLQQLGNTQAADDDDEKPLII